VATMSIDQSRNLLLNSASLRGQTKFKEAIDLLERHLPDVHEHLQENALLELIYAALEGNRHDKALTYARRLAEIDPDIPTVRRLLAGAGTSE
jgi:tetratricopeptide (TPR) repeat protein